MGIFSKFGQQAGKKLKGMLGVEEDVAKPTPEDAPAAAPEPEPKHIPPVQEPDVPTPISEHDPTGMPPRDPMDEESMLHSIDELGAQGQMGPIEAEGLQGRTGRRNINLDFFEDDMTKKTIEYFNREAGGFQDNPARKVVSHEETIKKSVAGAENVNELKDRMKRIIGGDINDKWEPEDIVGIYHMMQKQGEELREYAKELKTMRTAGHEPSKEDMAHFQLLSSRFTALQEIASVRAAEAGRMLNALQAVSKAGGRQYYEDMDQIVRGAGGENSIWVTIDRVADAEDIKDVAASARQSWWSKTYHTLVQLRYKMMLSSVRTHFANIIGSGMTGVFETSIVNPTKVAINNMEFATRALVQHTFGKGGMKAEDRMRLSEIVDVPRATIMATRRGFANARKVLSGEMMGHGKVYNEMGIRPSDPNLEGGGMLPEALQIPTKMLEAEDAFFRSTYGNARLEILARRKALAEAKTSEEVDALTNTYMKSPTDDMLNDAQEYAGRLTFTNDPSYYGSALHTLSKTLSTAQDHPMGRLILPFVRTPMNILGYTLENTAIGKLAAPRKLMADLQNPETRADAEARIAIAAGLYAMMHSYWEEGKITGAAPRNYGVYRAREAAGWRENAIRIGDEYYELNRMDPLGLIMAMFATAYDTNAHLTEEDRPTAAAASVVTVASMLTDRSVLSGLGDLERVFQSSERSVGKQAGKFLARIGTSFFIPAAMRDMREMKDPYKRALEVPDTLWGATWESVVKSTMNAAPILSEDLPPQVDAFGDDKLSTGNFLYRGLVPIRRGEIKQDPVSVALIATATPVNKPDYLIGLDGFPKIDLLQMDGGKGWVYRMYQQRVGKARYDAVKKVISTSGWNKLVEQDSVVPDSEAADLINQAVRTARRAATLEFIKDMSGKSAVTPYVGGKKVGKEINLTHAFNVQEYAEITRMLRQQGPTEEVKEKMKGAGLKEVYKPEQKGLPEEMRF